MKNNGIVEISMNTTPERCRISIKDPISRLTVLEADLSPDQFLRCISGVISGDKIPCVWGDIRKVGYERYTTTIWIPESEDVEILSKKVKDLSDRYGGDWSCRKGDYGNSHYASIIGRKRGYKVVFTGLFPPGTDISRLDKRIQSDHLSIQPK